MTLDEAIKHAEEVMVENLEKTKGRNASDPIALNCFKCAEEHRQLAEWLRELKAYKEQTDGDLISRQAVLEVYDEWRYGKGITYTNGLQRLREQFEKLPSAEKTTLRTEKTTITDGDLISRDFMEKLGATCIAKRSEAGELVAISSINILPSAEKTTINPEKNNYKSGVKQ